MIILDQHIDMALEVPNGIQKLRELILTLAMQGKLVDQDPNDPPAKELLKAIEAEKKRLIQAGKIKKQKPLPPIKEDEIPYPLPDGWVWCRLGDVTDYAFSKKVESDEIQTDTWVLELSDIEKQTSKLLGKVRHIDRPFKSTKTLFNEGDGTKC